MLFNVCSSCCQKSLFLGDIPYQDRGIFSKVKSQYINILYEFFFGHNAHQLSILQNHLIS